MTNCFPVDMRSIPGPSTQVSRFAERSRTSSTGDRTLFNDDGGGFGTHTRLSVTLAAECAVLDEYEDACSEAFEIDAYDADRA